MTEILDVFTFRSSDPNSELPSSSTAGVTNKATLVRGQHAVLNPRSIHAHLAASGRIVRS